MASLGDIKMHAPEANCSSEFPGSGTVSPIRCVKDNSLSDRDMQYTKDNVVLMLEYMSDRATKFNFVMLRIVTIFCIVLLAVEVKWKTEGDTSVFIDNNELLALNTYSGFVVLLLFLAYLSAFIYFLVSAAKSRKQFSRRRKRLCTLAIIDSILGLMSVVR